jgi:hypothetical protein
MKINIQIEDNDPIVVYETKPKIGKKNCCNVRTVAVIGPYHSFKLFRDSFHYSKEMKFDILNGNFLFAGTRYIWVNREDRMMGYHLDGIVVVGPHQRETDLLIGYAKTRFYH